MLDLFGMPVTDTSGISDPVDAVFDESINCVGCKIVTFINPYNFSVARKSRNYYEVMKSFDFVFCDGISVAKVASLEFGLHIQRLSFDFGSIAGEVFSRVAKDGGKVLLVGSTPRNLHICKNRLEEMYPTINVSGLIDGYTYDCQDLVRKIVQMQPDVVICGMGAPLQDIVLCELKSAGWAGLAFTCGGFYDQFAEKAQYYPGWVNRYNLRFAYRLIREPRRLSRRYFIDYRHFFVNFLISRARCIFSWR